MFNSERVSLRSPNLARFLHSESDVPLERCFDLWLVHRYRFVIKGSCILVSVLLQHYPLCALSSSLYHIPRVRTVMNDSRHSLQLRSLQLLVL